MTHMFGILIISTFFLVTQPADTTIGQSRDIEEVVVVSSSVNGQRRSPKGATATIDEHLAELPHVSLVRRGAYAMEPVVNNMSSERVSTTIDGMKIFYACTDKMDPVTSYVESANLQSIVLSSGLSGNPQSTGNIGGSLDLRLRKSGFLNAYDIERSGKRTVTNVGVSAGYETNGNAQAYGLDFSATSSSLYNDIGVFFRDAGNYRQGGGDVVPFSQFRKINVFDNAGLRVGDSDVLEGTFIYDRASDVGYPALNMDVSKAEAFITSLSHRHVFDAGVMTSLETKAYYNHITHVMDDTKRPDTQIHMDMPGESWTAGVYSLLRAGTAHHDAAVNYDLYYNRVFADMTMYPGGAAPMYMVTWPDVGTLNTGLALNDNISLGAGHSLVLSSKVAWQTQRLNSEEGYNALRVFFPGMSDSYMQLTGRVAAGYRLSTEHSRLSVGAGWGSRAPTVTEAYGYYLNNTFDQYDYIGNPRLSNESATEINGDFMWWSSLGASRRGRLTLKADANAFFFSNYIIGEFEDRLSAMTVDAEGVKVYGNISHAVIVNSSFSADVSLPVRLFRREGKMEWRTKIGYSIGRDDEDDYLPFISPFSYSSSLSAECGRLTLRTELTGCASQSCHAAKYGESKTPAYAVCNINAAYSLLLSGLPVTIHAGVENLFDKRYTTYSDWCGIPQKGRNIYVNLTMRL